MKKQASIAIILIVFMVFMTPTSTASTYKTKISSNSTCDIVLKDIKTDTIVFKNKTIKISYSVKNSGNNRCKGFYLDYFLKSCNTGQKVYLGSSHITGLGPGETQKLNLSFKVPNTISNADYIVRIFADSTNILNETNKNNNVGYSLKKLTVVTGRPVYITSDNIKTNAKDNARIDAIVKGLKAMGLYAVNYGLGPNMHYNVLKNISVPQNALIINIYGGACAGTIWEMSQNYYKKALGTRKVFSIWINTNINIRTVKFLKRSSDDNSTPKYGTKGGFPQFQDNNNDGIFEPELGEHDGLADPGKFLERNGYKFLYQQDGNIEKIINAIYNQATN